MSKILTLYFTKDKSTFNPNNFERIVNQIGVEQEIYIVSREPINFKEFKNIVVHTNQDWPVPLRIGYSFNIAIKRIDKNITEFKYIFKVDDDVILPENYLLELVKSKPIVAGIGPALLISIPFYLNILNGKYPINYCDDGYISALAISKGIWPELYNGNIIIPSVITLKEREYIYGVEYYKWGLHPLLFIILFTTRVYLIISKKMKLFQKKSFKAFLYNFVGYLHAYLNNYKKYNFHKEYTKMRILHLINSFFKYYL
ncbi:MAG: hypothetical protein QXL14_01175 [Candidatus Aenigmatarchaeota archaeon]